MIQKYRINFDEKYKIKSFFQRVLALFVKIIKHFSSNHKNNKKWNIISTKGNAKFVMILKKFLRHIYRNLHSKELFVGTILLFLSGSFLMFFYATIDNNKISLASEFKVSNIPTKTYNFENNSSFENKSSMTESSTNSKETNLDENANNTETDNQSRLYFVNENSAFFSWNKNLKINSEFNYDIKSGQQDIKIVWDQLYDSNFNSLNASSCVFNIYPYANSNAISTTRAKYKNGKCTIDFAATDQFGHNSFYIQAQITDSLGNIYNNESTLILKQ